MPARLRWPRSLLDEVGITVHRDTEHGRADLMLRWKGGAITELAVPLWRTPPRRLRTDEDTIELVCRLAAFYPDAKMIKPWPSLRCRQASLAGSAAAVALCGLPLSVDPGGLGHQSYLLPTQITPAARGGIAQVW